MVYVSVVGGPSGLCVLTVLQPGNPTVNTVVDFTGCLTTADTDVLIKAAWPAWALPENTAIRIALRQLCLQFLVTTNSDGVPFRFRLNVVK